MDTVDEKPHAVLTQHNTPKKNETHVTDTILLFCSVAMLLETDRETAKPRVDAILRDIETFISEDKVPLYTPSDDYCDSDEDEPEEVEVKPDACGAAGGAAADHKAKVVELREADDDDGNEQPSKRARTRISTADKVRGVDCCTMAVDAALQITDTGKVSSKEAHELILAVVSTKSLFGKARDGGYAFFRQLMAAVSTPFAAFYLDMDPANRRSSFWTCKESIAYSLSNHLSKCIDCDPSLPARIRQDLSQELVRKVYSPTPTQQAIADRLGDIVDGCMRRLVSHLAAVRERWQRSSVRMIKTTFYEVETPASPGVSVPQISVTIRRLPADILPPAAAHTTDIDAHSSHYKLYSRGSDRFYDCERTLDSIKFELAEYVRTVDPPMKIEIAERIDPLDVAVDLVVRRTLQ